MSKDLRKLINDILREGYLISLGTVDDGGVWVTRIVKKYDIEQVLRGVGRPKNGG